MAGCDSMRCYLKLGSLVSFWMMELQNGGGQVMALNQERPGE